MIQPKVFYRKIDALLSKISQEEGEKSLLPSVLKELVSSFGEDLHIKSGRLYRQGRKHFVLVKNLDKVNRRRAGSSLDLNQPVLQSILQQGSYIHGDPTVTFGPKVEGQKGHLALAAFVVEEDNNRWLMMFELGRGWEREEIEFCLNTVRTVVGYRIAAERFQSDLRQAAQIQLSLLPDGPPPITGYQVAGRQIPAELVGGDLYDYYPFDDGCFGVAVGDASGHGLPAALLVRDIVTGLRMGIEKELKIRHVFDKLNRVIHNSRLSTGFISLFYGELESNGNLFYINAGQPPPLLFSQEKIQELSIGGIPIGPLPETEFKRGFAHLDHQGVLLLYTDGLIERKSKGGHQFGIQRLKELLLKHRADRADQILDLIFDYAQKFGKVAKWEDDITVVVIKRTL